MSNVKMISIDLIAAPDAQGELSSVGELGVSSTSKGNEFAKLVDSELSQKDIHQTDKNTKPTAKPADADAAKLVVEKDDVQADVSNEATSETAQSKQSDEEKALSLQQSDEKSVVSQQENIDEESLAIAKGEQFIEMLSKSEQLLKVDNKQISDDVSINLANSLTADGFAKSSLSEVINQSMQNVNEVAGKSALTDGEQLLAEASKQRLATLHQNHQSIEAKASNQHQAELSENLAGKEVVLDELTVEDAENKGATTKLSTVSKGEVSQTNKEVVNQADLSQAKPTAVNELNDEELASIVEQTKQKPTLVDPNSMANKQQVVEQSNNKNLKVDINQSKSEATPELESIELQKHVSVQAGVETGKAQPTIVAGQVVSAEQLKVENSAEKRINNPTQQIVIPENFADDTEFSGEENAQQQTKEQQFNQQQTVNVSNGVNNKSIIAETIASMGNNKVDSEQSIIEQKSVQQQLESIANRVIESNQEFKKVEQVKQETINIYRRDFANAVKDKVMVMISQKLQQVDIQLDPPELGNVHVRLNLQGEQAAVSFTVQNQQAKEAFEQQMGKLREMLQESGVDVGDANVAQQQQDGSDSQEQGFASQGTLEAEDNIVVEESLAHLVNHSATGVDFYA